MALKLVTPPDHFPVTVAEAKAHMALEHNDDDDTISGFIATAVEAAQLILGRQLVAASYELQLSQFPAAHCWGQKPRENHNAIDLPNPPLIEVTSVTYLDADGLRQTLPAERYTVDVDSLVGNILPAYGLAWPAARFYPGSVRIAYSCGWPMDDNTRPPVWTGPKSIKTWIMVRVATMYENRESIVTGQAAAELPRSYVDGLLDAHRIYKVV